MITIINKLDIAEIGDLAKSCDNFKLKIAIDQATNFDLAPLMCNLFVDMVSNISVTKYQTLLNGGFYKDCKDNTQIFPGVKKTLAYYAYSRYLFVNEYNDRPIGNVTFNDNFSVSKTFNQIKLFAENYREMGLESWNQNKGFLCANKDNYPLFNSNECPECNECLTDNCDGTPKAKGYGLKIRVVK